MKLQRYNLVSTLVNLISAKNQKLKNDFESSTILNRYSYFVNKKPLLIEWFFDI